MTVQINGTTGIDTIQDNTVTSAKIVNGAVTPADTQVGALPSVVRVHTQNGHGSTNTKIARFTTVQTNQGSDITYADDSSLGAKFTINTNGVYSISYTDSFTAANGYHGLSLNSTELTTSVFSIAIATLLGYSITSTATGGTCMAFTGYFSAGSEIRPHTSGATRQSQGNSFTITRVA
jgi:hypothetical protein